MKDEYQLHANTVFWLMSEKGFTMAAAIKVTAKKHDLIKTKLERELRKILPEDFLANRKRAAQNNWVAPMMIDEFRK